jgi:hypothetical protein
MIVFVVFQRAIVESPGTRIGAKRIARAKTPAAMDWKERSAWKQEYG